MDFDLSSSSQSSTQINIISLRDYLQILNRSVIMDWDSIVYPSQSNTQAIRETQEVCSQQFDQTIFEDKVWGRLFPCRNSKLPVFDLSEEKYTFGRGAVNYQFTERMFDKTFLSTISKQHFLIYRDFSSENDAVVVLEDKSQNGTYVNKLLVGKNKKKVLRNNDEIALALAKKKVFVFYDCLHNDAENYPACLTQKYTIARKIGSGSYGEVRLAYSEGTLNRVAVKIVKKKILSSKGTTFRFNTNQINNEVELLRSVDHPCVVKLIDIIEGPDDIYIVMELAEGGELFDRIVESGTLKEETVKLYFYQLVHAVLYLHKKKVTHRDIKPENILLESEDEFTTIKLTDFGLSKLTQDTSIMTSLCGTPAYIAPELLTYDEKRSYNSKVDMWSLGCVLFVCLAGYPPFNGENDRATQMNIKTGKYKLHKSIWEKISKSALDLVQQILVVNPEARLSAEEVLQHEWLNDPEMINRAHNLMYPPIQCSPPKRPLEGEDLTDSKTPRLMSGVEFNLNKE